jgi:hypothetical protein
MRGIRFSALFCRRHGAFINLFISSLLFLASSHLGPSCSLRGRDPFASGC